MQRFCTHPLILCICSMRESGASYHPRRSERHIGVPPYEVKGPAMSLQLGQTAPDFEEESTHGQISFHEWLGDSWGVLFSHPKDFTPVCTTELGEVARLRPE